MSKNISSCHHCIPQYYLNQFGNVQKNKTYNIFVYNKNEPKKFTNSVANIGYIKDYNTLITNGNKDDTYEKMHDDIFEKKLSKYYYQIIKKIKNYFDNFNCINCLSNKMLIYMQKNDCLGQEDKHTLSFMLAYFIIRSKKIRYAFEDLMKKSELIFHDIYVTNKLDMENYKQNVEKEIGSEYSRKKSYIKLPFDASLLNELTEVIFSHIWNIGYNNTENLLYTSDIGHALDCMNQKYITRGISYGSYANVIMFPLDPKICIIMYDKNYIKAKKEFIIDRKFVFLNKEIIKTINENIVFDAMDEIYSKDGNWEDLEEFVKKSNLPVGHKSYLID